TVAPVPLAASAAFLTVDLRISSPFFSPERDSSGCDFLSDFMVLLRVHVWREKVRGRIKNSPVRLSGWHTPIPEVCQDVCERGRHLRIHHYRRGRKKPSAT